MTVRLPLATGNPEKVALVQGIAGPLWQVYGCDPRDAELNAETGYRPGAAAKARAVGERNDLPFVVAHDSGFEFACLAGAPGPRTGRWLRDSSPSELVGALVPGSKVEVVHCLALWIQGRITTVEYRDTRRVVSDPRSMVSAGELPLSNVVVGEQSALARAFAEVLLRISAPPSLLGPK